MASKDGRLVTSYTTRATRQSLQYILAMDLYRSCPAVSQNQNLIFCPCKASCFSKYTAPRVDSISAVNCWRTQRTVRLLLPTPTAPITTTLALTSLIIILCMLINKSMHFSKTTQLPPRLPMPSPRNQYTRRLPHHSQTQVERVWKLLQQDRGPSRGVGARMQTQSRERSQTRPEEDLEGMRRVAKLQAQALCRKQGGVWRQVGELYQRVKGSSSKQLLARNDLAFLLKLTQAIKQQREQPPKKKEEPSRHFQMEILKLQREVELLKQQFAHPDHPTVAVETLPIPSLARVESSPPQTVQNTELLREVEWLRQANDKLRQQKQSQCLKIGELRTSNQNLCEEVLKLRDSHTLHCHKLDSWRNIMAMQHEETLSLLREINDLRAQINDLTRKYQAVLKKVTKMPPGSHAVLQELTKKSLEVFSEQAESFLKVRLAFAARPCFSSASSGATSGKQEGAYRKFLGEKEAVGNSEGVKRNSRQNYRYFRPSFFALLEKYFEHQGVDKQNFAQLQLPLDLHFLATLRAILDAKHNEYLLEPHQLPTALAPTAVSWLATYTIEPRTRQQIPITTDLCLQTLGSFYVRLMSPSLNGNWQVSTFRELLLDTLSPDQLLFYLRARHCLVRAGCSCFSQTCYVGYIQALAIMQQLVADFDYRKKLEEFLKRAVEFQRRKQLVDAHFILRLLLEYYQFRKNRIFAQLSKTFHHYSRANNNSFSFEAYLKIFHYNFAELPLTARTVVYQRAFAIGRGLVSIEAVLTVLNEEGWLRCEVHRMFSPHNIARLQTSQQLQEGSQGQAAGVVEGLREYLRGEGEGVVRAASERLGVESVRAQLGQGGLESWEQLVERCELSWKVSLLDLRSLLSSRRFREQQLVVAAAPLLSFLPQLMRSSVGRRALQVQVQQVRKRQAARLILRFYRRKKGCLSRSYTSNFAPSDPSKAKASELKREFAAMIDSLKKKYNVPRKPCSEAELTS